MVEIEIGVLRGQCLDRRINDPKRALSVRLPPGRNSATPPAPKSNGCSRPTKPAPKWGAAIPIRPKSHNHCGELLGTPCPNRSVGAEEFIVHPIAGQGTRGCAATFPSARLQSAEAEETQNREHDDDGADEPDQIVHGEPFSCLGSGQL
ncbi:hypothetical protein ELH84_10225 [Rhizobium ruizarguesonis]|nr:hypothetical protein ELH84_10225 [Rhizobium ruizarguesonis]